MKKSLLMLLLCLAAPLARASPTIMHGTKHNLATTQPGEVVTKTSAVCVTCHVPPARNVITPEWEPTMRPARTAIFAARGGSSRPGRPSGASKMCLSCHDGTIAPGNIVSQNQQITAATRMERVSKGQPMLGSDLCDDHPISVAFTQSATSKNTWLKDPASLNGPVKLDHGGLVQCTSCHDPHDDTNGKFLTQTLTNAQLCKSCHEMGLTTVPHHQDCMGCHQTHTAPSGQRLLKMQTISEDCLNCHNGKSPTRAPNIAADLRKFAIHDTNVPIEFENHAPSDASCSDCHDPHTMKVKESSAPMIRGNFGDVAGISALGMPVARARYEYEVCFKCHGDKTEVEPIISRVIAQKNIRLKFSTSAVSFHPVEARGVSSYVPSLKPSRTPGSLIYCTDCHSSDGGKVAGRSGPNGPHGSDVNGLLAARYETTDYTPESAQAYALCYGCHERSSILQNQSFKLHSVHIVKSKTPCSVCHDPHGIPSEQGSPMHNAKLINFDVRIVQKSSDGTREYISLGNRSGSCSLTCHGVEHTGFGY